MVSDIARATIQLSMELDFPDDDSVLVNGLRYVTARKLGEQYGLSPKYIAHLALESKVQGEFLGRLWYIRPTSLHSYLRDESITHWREAEAQSSDQS
jgi:hypothetical protein